MTIASWVWRGRSNKHQNISKYWLVYTQLPRPIATRCSSFSSEIVHLLATLCSSQNKHTRKHHPFFWGGSMLLHGLEVPKHPLNSDFDRRFQNKTQRYTTPSSQSTPTQKLTLSFFVPRFPGPPWRETTVFHHVLKCFLIVLDYQVGNRPFSEKKTA